MINYLIYEFLKCCIRHLNWQRFVLLIGKLKVKQLNFFKIKLQDTNENFQRQGSLRKIIPPQHTKALFGRQNEDLNDFYKIFRQEYIILAE